MKRDVVTFETWRRDAVENSNWKTTTCIGRKVRSNS